VSCAWKTLYETNKQKVNQILNGVSGVVYNEVIVNLLSRHTHGGTEENYETRQLVHLVPGCDGAFKTPLNASVYNHDTTRELPNGLS
jgi:hypothetical protein